MVMRKQLMLHAGVLVAVAALASVSFAGDFHYGQNLICSDCHVMHYSQAHGYNADGSGIFAPMDGTGPHEYLLRNDVNDLCLACHDGQSWAPDVFESHANGYVRQAGALNELGGNGLYPAATGHTLNSTDVAPGGTFSNPGGLECTDCHSPHGRTRGITTTTDPQGAYRNLFVDLPSFVSITYSRLDVELANDLTKWVFEDASSGVSANHYGYNHITFNEPNAAKSAYGDFCKACHTNFHGDVGGAELGGVDIGGGLYEEFHRHPTNGSNIGAIGGGHSSLSRFAGKVNQVQVMSPAGKRAGTYTSTDTDLSPSCMSCHKSHGNQNAFGLIYMLGTGTVTEQGDAGVDARNLCRQCHGMGGASAALSAGGRRGRLSGLNLPLGWGHRQSGHCRCPRPGFLLLDPGPESGRRSQP